MSLTTAQDAAASRAAERRFHLGMSAVLLVTVFTGFARSYYLRPWFPGWPSPPERFFYTVHGVLFTAWFVLLVVQAWLVGRRRLDLHRRLGWVGALVAVAMMPIGLYGVVISARRDLARVDMPFSPLPYLTVPVFDMVVFGLLIAAAVRLRRDAASHKRLMLIASISVATAAFARLPLVLVADPADIWRFLAVTDLFLVPLVVRDVRTRGHVHPATMWGGALLVFSQPFRLWLGHTDAWLMLASALTH